ncbi:hypothetical protein BWQ96_03843 [Gracilariopsis chorda]|uniref:Uncharacterized protein n=1 Tax=Gracilariopsis chorda TaxID=448386 RepID=A0A2V3IW28_9FLOR|nr:hypothetical protein BWQ96_03843 [Gracilariopsis chorda]|eukprot:PXF46344.1 hypothetical protein BWQ96_03843 [Gracilariopsis chorda]
MGRKFVNSSGVENLIEWLKTLMLSPKCGKSGVKNGCGVPEEGKT